MATFKGELPTELIEMFKELELNTDQMLSDMVKAGAEVVQASVNAKMPKALREGLITPENAIRVTKAYDTPSDGAKNCQVYISGYFINSRGKKTPAPLVANLFEYGRSSPDYPKKPFLRSSFNKKKIEEAMLQAQAKYIKES